MRRKTTPGSRLPAEETWHPYEQLKLETVLQETGERISLDPFVVFLMLPQGFPGKTKISCTRHEPGPWTAALARVKPELVIGKTIYCRRCSEQYKYSG